MTTQPVQSETPTTDERIAAAVRALAAGRGVRAVDLAPIIGIGKTRVFAKLKGEAMWKASEVEAVADYFDVSVGELFDGLGLFRDTKKPHRVTGGASSSGAPSGTRTPDPLIKSLEGREAGAVIEVDFGETRGRRTMVG